MNAIPKLATASALLIALAADSRASFVVASNYNPANPSYFTSFAGIGFAGTSPNNGVFTNQAVALEFTAAASGVISTIETPVGQIDAGGVPLVISISTASGWLPGALLGSETFSASQVATTPIFQTTFDFSALKIGLVAGQSYFISFSVATPIQSDYRYAAELVNPVGPPLRFLAPVLQGRRDHLPDLGRHRRDRP